jgi:hypothetical protein
MIRFPGAGVVNWLTELFTPSPLPSARDSPCIDSLNIAATPFRAIANAIELKVKQHVSET